MDTAILKPNQSMFRLASDVIAHDNDFLALPMLSYRYGLIAGADFGFSCFSHGALLDYRFKVLESRPFQLAASLETGLISEASAWYGGLGFAVILSLDFSPWFSVYTSARWRYPGFSVLDSTTIEQSGVSFIPRLGIALYPDEHWAINTEVTLMQSWSTTFGWGIGGTLSIGYRL